MSESAGHIPLLEAGFVARLGRLELVARHVVEGFISGKHRSPYRGFSVEFAEHRPYVAGDEVRDIDWRIYAKRDRYYVKQYEQETNLRVYIVLDASGSMRYTDRPADRSTSALSKFRYAQCLAAGLAYLMLHQQDAVGLVTFDRSLRRYIPPRSRPGHLQVILDELESTSAGEETSLPEVLHDLAERIRRRGLVMLISDCFGDLEALRRALYHFRHRRHEVIVFQVLHPDELSFPFRDRSQFRDLESPLVRLTVDPRALRRHYLERLRAFLDDLQRACGQLRIDRVLLRTDEPLDYALAAYLAYRLRR